MKDDYVPKSRLNFIITIMVIILVFMFLGTALSIFLENEVNQYQHQRSISDRLSIKEEQKISQRERYENRQMIQQLMKRVEILEGKIK